MGEGGARGRPCPPGERERCAQNRLSAPAPRAPRRRARGIFFCPLKVVRREPPSPPEGRPEVPSMRVTAAVFQLEMSPLKALAL